MSYSMRSSREQLANARKNSAKAARERAQRGEIEFDWDRAIAGLKAMFDAEDDGE
ncbi:MULTISPECIES: hypothetical protein [Mycobacterium]|uniref:Antitoxin n=1 Tax=Mycobacterium botniense TaxID=84962 RepID=A0A7I9XRU2_9MYCO|nr:MULTISPECIES: hypothetical protein [Mycobacterium]GFG72711.1 hypothetical protein MBOT_00760 [Mycobacterium botniense]